MHISIIACIASNNAIGYKNTNTLLYNIREELQHFARVTKSVLHPGNRNVVLMGYNTFVSMGMRVLPGRINHVISASHNKEELPEHSKKCDNIFFFKSPLESLEWCHNDKTIETLYVIGGASIYEFFIRYRLCNRGILTRIVSPQQRDTDENYVYFPYEPFLELEWDYIEESPLVRTTAKNMGTSVEEEVEYVVTEYKENRHLNINIHG